MMYNSGPFTQLYKYGPVFFQKKKSRAYDDKRTEIDEI